MTRTLQLKVNIPLYGEGDEWEYRASKCPAKGKPGISYRRDVEEKIGPNAVLETLLYYNNEGRLAGILNYVPNDIQLPEPWMKAFVERAGTFNVLVAPKHRGRGIGMKLLREAVRRWPIDFEQQNYTVDGARLVQRFLSAR
jgi:GNAT superfamily N-acetyltransferase